MSTPDPEARNLRTGARIRKQRQALGLDQRELAERVGVHVNSVQKWESGTHFPGRKLGRLEQVLGISLDDEPEAAVPPGLADYIRNRSGLPAEIREQAIAVLEDFLSRPPAASAAVPSRRSRQAG